MEYSINPKKPDKWDIISSIISHLFIASIKNIIHLSFSTYFLLCMGRLLHPIHLLVNQISRSPGANITSSTYKLLPLLRKFLIILFFSAKNNEVCQTIQQEFRADCKSDCCTTRIPFKSRI